MKFQYVSLENLPKLVTKIYLSSVEKYEEEVVLDNDAPYPFSQ